MLSLKKTPLELPDFFENSLGQCGDNIVTKEKIRSTGFWSQMLTTSQKAATTWIRARKVVKGTHASTHWEWKGKWNLGADFRSRLTWA